MADWMSYVGAVGGLIGAIGGVGATVVAVPAWRASKASAEAAARSAKAAEDSAAEARRLSTVELDRRHEELSPKPSLKVEFDVEPNQRLPGHRSLMAVVEVPRTYRVRAAARVGNTHWNLGLPLVLQAGYPMKVEVEKWPPGRAEPEAEEVILRFWPPTDTDQVEPWTCRCGRPVVEGAGPRPAGHWEAVVPVNYSDPTESVW